MATQSTRPMVSETSICNQALSWVGANPISSLDESKKSAEWCRNNYPFIRDAVLEEFMWSFARDRVVKTVADQPVWGDGLYKFSMPLDWVQVFQVFQDEYETPVEWEKEGRFILAKSETVYMKGVKRIVDTGFFSALFVDALATRIAAEAAVPLAENPRREKELWVSYRDKILWAQNRDGMQGRNRKVRKGNLTTNARRGTMGRIDRV